MKTIYLDSEFRCHVTNDGTMSAVETDFFDGKCDEFVEGYRLVPEGCMWTRADGEVFCGEMIVPWKPWNELDAAQREYEKNRAEMEDLKTTISELDAALLESTYNNLTGGV